MVIKRFPGAAWRAIACAVIVVLPAFMLPGTPVDTVQVMLFSALVLGAWVFADYLAEAPTLIDFRDAKPLNRFRAIVVAVMLAGLSMLAAGQSAAPHAAFSGLMGQALDLPLSPLRTMLVLAPDGPGSERLTAMLGFAVVWSVLAGVLFALLIRLLNWPLNAGAFNVHTNLPMFDPTSGDDILLRLKRQAHVNILFATLAPVLVPVVLRLMGLQGALSVSQDPHAAVWMVAIWALAPVFFAMRAMAVLRVTELIAEKRRRAYAQRTPADDGWQLA